MEIITEYAGFDAIDTSLSKRKKAHLKAKEKAEKERLQGWADFFNLAMDKKIK